MSKKIVFKQPGDFEAFHAAEQWCRDNGISFGSMERGNPIGLMRGNWSISKWSNMTKKEQSECHGTMTAKAGFRSGPVTITMEGGAA
jgi:hypothetical protein